MGIFGQQILNRKRVKELDKFIQGTIHTLIKLADESKTKVEENLYLKMAKEVTKINFLFYDKKTLRSSVERKGNKVYGYSVMGERITQITLITQGDKKRILKQEHINMPADHVFHGDVITKTGALTLWHELAHFGGKSHFRRHIERMGIPYHASEEAAADFLAAKVAKKQGFNDEAIMQHSIGRTAVFGQSFPRYWNIMKGL